MYLLCPTLHEKFLCAPKTYEYIPIVKIKMNSMFTHVLSRPKNREISYAPLCRKWLSMYLMCAHIVRFLKWDWHTLYKWQKGRLNSETSPSISTGFCSFQNVSKSSFIFGSFACFVNNFNLRPTHFFIQQSKYSWNSFVYSHYCKRFQTKFRYSKSYYDL